ncbi:protein AHNAK2-like [Phoca vitulina]|uniref:protein AHNAK2-like n=1 Tax=Phoca vitulina TaxID=9720 RepID=UPI0013964D18|nr:protein AHNAK2-like [Phoca vitulina]
MQGDVNASWLQPGQQREQKRLQLAAELWARSGGRGGRFLGGLEELGSPPQAPPPACLGPTPDRTLLRAAPTAVPRSLVRWWLSGRQLQPEEPDADTEEDHSVTEGPVDEIIRPRPQGSSPVYEHAAEGAGSELPEDTPRRRASSGSGGRRSWWKRESGDSRTFSRMSHPQEATEVTLMTEAEAGASGYSVTGGGDQGIFVKQVLKDSSAAKLFSLREGDQLLSATIFFDNIKYEDALKILQYSEPYKVQFQVKRKRPATEDEEGVARGAQHGPKGSEKQDKDVADGSTETPTQTLEGGGDQERLLAKSREGRCRRPQKERLSWPKFQSITSKHMPGPRRSHSSSGAYGRGDAPDVSPTSTDTEAQLPAEDQEQKAGPDGQRKRRFLNLRFRMGSGKGPTLEGRPSRGVQGGALQAGVVEEAGSWEDRREATEATVQSRGEDRTAEVPAGTPIEPGAPSQGALGEGASVASRRRKQTKDTKDAEDAVSEGKPGVSSAPQGGEGLREVAQGMETGIARSALQGKGDAQGRQPEFQIQIPSLKTPMFKLSKERNQDTEGGTAPLAQGDGLGGTAAEETHPAGEGAPGPQLAAPRKPKVHLPEREEGGAGGPEEGHREREKKDGDKDKGGREERRTVLRFNIPSFGWSPRKDVRAAGEKPILDLDQEIGSTVKVKVLHTEDKEILGEEKEETRDPRGGQPTTAEEQRLEGDLSLGDKEVAARDSKFKMPKFKMPSFGASAPSKDLGTSVDVSGLASSAEEATAFPVPDGHLPPAGVPASMVAEGQAGTAGTSAAAPEGAPAEGAGRKGQGRPMTAPGLKLPSFSWSPKKGVESKADPGHSPAVAADALGGPPGGPVTPAEAGADASLGKDGEAGAVRTPALARLKVAPPGMEASTWGAGLPRGDPGLALAGPTDTAGGEGGVGGADAAAGTPEGADVSLHLPEAPVPSLGFVKPDLSPGGATMEGSLSTGRLPLPKHGLSLRDSTQEHGPGDSSASQLCGDVTASSAEDPLQPSPAVGSPGRDAAVAEAPAGSRESWFRMPSLRLPGFGRAPKERAGSAGLGAQRPAPVAAGVPGEGEAAAEVRSADARAPTSEVDVAKGLSASEVRVRPGAGSLPLQLHAALAEPCVPPGEAGEPPLPGAAAQGLGRGAQGAEGPPSQPEGPLRLRASSTEVPSQVSVVNVGQVWEDSVLRVQFPKLKVPRFTFLAPGSEADVFVPSVTELSSCPQSGPDTALLEQSPGGRGTSFPKAPVALGLSSEAAPVCKVRVHIQGTEAASRQVAVHSMVTAGYAELSGPEAFPTQMVQESEVPASETQTPSYGVSLLKGRVPEPPTWAQVHLVTAECGLGGRLREAREPVPGADPVSGDLQPDTGEPFEMICPSVDVPGPPACSSDLHSGHGHADSCSDEEPAEILEFPPEEGQEAEAAQAPKGKPEGISSSGLFRFWLPSIGFSSSASETSADSQADAQRPAPVQTQPEARTPPSQEKGGWFRFPKLGFSSSPTKKSESEEEEVSLAEQSLQEEAGTFYDARESFSPEETGAGELAEAAGARQGSGTMVTSTARTELILLERDGAASQQSAPRPATK